MRPLAVATLCLPGLLAGCTAADPAPWSRDVALLREEVRALRSEREADRRKLESLEAHLVASRRPALSRTESTDVERVVATPAPARSATRLVPRQLEVVKLKPAEDEADSSMFISGSSEGAPKLVRSSRAVAMGGPTGGPDAAPPLPTDVTIGEPPASGLPSPAAPPVLAEARPSEGYTVGLAALAAGETARARSLLEAFVQGAPTDPSADNALLAIGDTLEREGQPGRALQVWERLVKEYPAGDSVARALVRYGEVCAATGRTAAARAAFERVIEDFGASDVAATARARLAQL